MAKNEDLILSKENGGKLLTPAEAAAEKSKTQAKEAAEEAAMQKEEMKPHEIDPQVEATMNNLFKAALNPKNPTTPTGTNTPPAVAKMKP